MTQDPDKNPDKTQVTDATAPVADNASIAEISAAPTEAEQAAKAIAELTQKLEQALSEAAQAREAQLRAAAEAENARRRSAEEITKARKFALESFAGDLLAVCDSLEAALANADDAKLRDGVGMTLKQLLQVLERQRVTPIAPAPGSAFDPHCHQAINTIASEQPAGSVAMLLQKGYWLAERVLRAALVSVSQGAAAPEAQVQQA